MSHLPLAFIAASLLAATAPPPLEEIPPAAEAALAAGEASYDAGDCAAALGSFAQAEAAGARSGLLFYQMGYCMGDGGNAAGAREYKQKALPYFQAAIDSGRPDVDPYYYLAATYFNDLQDPKKAGEVAARAIAAHRSGALGALNGEGLFRMGRLYGFAIDADPANAAPDLEKRKIACYRQATDVLIRESTRNSAYIILAATSVAEAAEESGNLEMAVRYYGDASNADPSREAPARALHAIALAAVARGDLQLAADAWLAVRGPGGLKTDAQYGLRLARRAVVFGKLPTTFEDAPISSLDQATLERGLLAAADVLRAAAIAEAQGVSDGSAPAAEEVERQRGLFLALGLSYLARGFDLRMFVLGNQLAPFIFR